MKCSFCQQECHLKEEDTGYEMWSCNNHPHLVKEIIDYTWHVMGNCTGLGCCPKKKHNSTIIYTTVGRYKIRFIHTPNKSFYVSKIDHQGFANLIFRLPFHPNLTPENLDQKLKLWITFS